MKMSFEELIDIIREKCLQYGGIYNLKFYGDKSLNVLIINISILNFKTKIIRPSLYATLEEGVKQIKEL